MIQNDIDISSFKKESNSFLAGAITIFLVIIIVGLLFG
jgi:hypothetical protein